MHCVNSILNIIPILKKYIQMHPLEVWDERWSKYYMNFTFWDTLICILVFDTNKNQKFTLKIVSWFAS